MFPLDPAARVELEGARARVTVGGTVADFEGTGIAHWRCEPAEYAPRFGARVPSTRLCATLTARECRTEIVVSGA